MKGAKPTQNQIVSKPLQVKDPNLKANCYLCNRDRGSWKLLGGEYNLKQKSIIKNFKFALLLTLCERCYRTSFNPKNLSFSPQTPPIETGVAVFPYCIIKVERRNKRISLTKDERKKLDARKTLQRMASNRNGIQRPTLTKQLSGSVLEKKRLIDEKLAAPVDETRLKREPSAEKRKSVENMLKNRPLSPEGPLVLPGGKPLLSPPMSREASPAGERKKSDLPPRPPSIASDKSQRSNSAVAGIPSPKMVQNPRLQSLAPPSSEDIKKRNFESLVKEKEPPKKEEESTGWFSGWFGGGKKKGKEEIKKKEEHNNAMQEELERKLNEKHKSK